MPVFRNVPPVDVTAQVAPVGAAITPNAPAALGSIPVGQIGTQADIARQLADITALQAPPPALTNLPVGQAAIAADLAPKTAQATSAPAAATLGQQVAENLRNLSAAQKIGLGAGAALSVAGIVNAIRKSGKQSSEIERIIDRVMNRQRTRLRQQGLRGLQPTVPTDLVLAAAQSRQADRDRLLRNLAQLGLVGGSLAFPGLSPLFGLTGAGLSQFGTRGPQLPPQFIQVR